MSLLEGDVEQMTNMDIAKCLLFHQLGIRKDTFKDVFEDRLIAQKKIYLLQSLGTDLGYYYSWYLHGPYSPSLTSYMYSNLDWMQESESILANYKLSSKTNENVRRVNELAQQPENDTNLGQSDWYELLASIHYIHKNRKSWAVTGKEEIFKKLQQYKPQYSKEQCEMAFGVLCEKGFLQNM